MSPSARSRTNGTHPTRPAEEGRYKSEAEYAIEERWRKVLIQGGSADDFGQAYDELHREFLQRQDDDHAEIYGEVNPRSSTEDRVRAVILRHAGEGARVLEVGTGDGETAYRLARQGNRVYSVDVSQIALDKARERWGGEGLPLEFAFGDARSLELPDGSFDLVVSENMVEHIALEDMRLHLQEVHRLLAPGGCYLLYTPSRLWSGRVSVGFHLHVYTLRELGRLMAAAGYRVTWLEPRLLHRTGRLVRIGGLGLRLACLGEALLQALRIERWPAAIKARVIPSIMICGEKMDTGKQHDTGSGA